MPVDSSNALELRGGLQALRSIGELQVANCTGSASDVATMLAGLACTPSLEAVDWESTGDETGHGIYGALAQLLERNKSIRKLNEGCAFQSKNDDRSVLLDGIAKSDSIGSVSLFACTEPRSAAALGRMLAECTSLNRIVLHSLALMQRPHDPTGERHALLMQHIADGLRANPA